VPPVTAGTYRIRRKFFGAGASHAAPEVMLEALIEVIP
jgi:hypothetical protein